MTRTLAWKFKKQKNMEKILGIQKSKIPEIRRTQIRHQQQQRAVLSNLQTLKFLPTPWGQEMRGSRRLQSVSLTPHHEHKNKMAQFTV
jgi:hypothetical protein